MKKVKIAIVSPGFPPLSYGGIDSAHYNLGKALAAANYTVQWFTYGDSKSCPTDQEYVHRFGLNKICAKLLHRVAWLFFKLRDRGKLAFQTCDILLSQWGAWRMRSAIKKFAPDIIFLPDQGAPALSLGMITNAKQVCISHHNPARFASPLLFNLAPSLVDIKMALSMENRGLRHCDLMICPTNYMKRCAQDSYQTTSPIRILPNLLAEDVLNKIKPQSVAAKLGKSDIDAQVIYIPSAGLANKGERYIFEIVRHIAKRNENFLFFLTGELSITLQQEFAEIPWLEGRVFAPGQLPYLENLSFVASSSVCLSPTLTENFGMAMIEAQYFGVPTVAFDIGGNSEIIKNNFSGILVPFLDIEALVEKTLDILSPQGRELYATMSQNAHVNAKQLAGSSAVNGYIRLIEELMENK